MERLALFAGLVQTWRGVVQQGKFLERVSAEHEDAIWKSYIFYMNLGTIKYLLNEAVDTLPKFKWNKKTNDKLGLSCAKDKFSLV